MIRMNLIKEKLFAFSQIETKGPRFEFDDFLIKLGSVTMNQNFKGVLVEVNNLILLIIM